MKETEYIYNNLVQIILHINIIENELKESLDENFYEKYLKKHFCKGKQKIMDTFAKFAYMESIGNLSEFKSLSIELEKFLHEFFNRLADMENNNEL